MVITSRQGEARRQSLVEAAFQCIAVKGFEGLRLREVAREAGIDHSTVHHYFATKEDLVGAVVEYATKQFWDTMPPQQDAAATLRNHLAILRDMMRRQPHLFVVLRELDLRATRDAVTTGVVGQNEEGWRQALCQLLPEAAPQVEPGATADLIISLARGVSLTPHLAADVFDQLVLLLGLPDNRANRLTE